MGFTEIFKSLLGGNPVQGLKDLIGAFKLAPEDKIKADEFTKQLEQQEEVMKLAADQAVRDHDEKMAELQSKNITTEENSTDSFVRRARPMFAYIIEACIAYSLMIGPIVNAFLHKGFVPIEIPNSYLELFGAYLLGYTGFRSWEKVSQATK